MTTPGSPGTPVRTVHPGTPGTPGTPAEPVLLERLADELAEVVRAVPGVSALHPGVLGEVGTYLPGRRVPGVRVREEVLTGPAGGAGVTPVEVHVVVTAAAPVRETAAAVHAAVSATFTARGVRAPVLVHVADVVDPRT
ncbi:hypothetical protein [Kineococcus rhizosphaerae]|uniref:Uncharacterized protein n=1 Tax=Kineococcus rhizosphaerae TaxID=559628 RepID=A0A2T0R3D4_9ACTN|nr:hypothetical protein [Kineococcus rhizosphaerae]PRY14569.1 hypothetical protein CLV37_106127 [Kineococcus rhizosphaerae]